MTMEVNSEHQEQLKKMALVGYILYAQQVPLFLLRRLPLLF